MDDHVWIFGDTDKTRRRPNTEGTGQREGFFFDGVTAPQQYFMHNQVRSWRSCSWSSFINKLRGVCEGKGRLTDGRRDEMRTPNRSRTACRTSYLSEMKQMQFKVLNHTTKNFQNEWFFWKFVLGMQPTKQTNCKAEPLRKCNFLF
jgi:hypothetical protein